MPPMTPVQAHKVEPGRKQHKNLEAHEGRDMHDGGQANGTGLQRVTPDYRSTTEF